MGVRRGRRVLKRARAVAAALLAAAAALPGLPGCAGLSADEESRLQLYRENSQGYMDRGEYLAALQQAGKALEIDPDLVSMKLVKGFCLVKLGKTHGNAAMIDEATSVFRELASSGDGSADFRVDLGLGTAGLARALAHDAEIERIGKRLASDFITDQGRAQEQARLEAEQDARLQCLREAESSLRDVLDDPLQKDNTYALVDLVLVLNSLAGHEDEALSLAERTLVLLDEDSHIKDLQLTARLPATARVDLQQRIGDNGEKELALRDLVATNHYRRGDVPGPGGRLGRGWVT